VVVIITSASGSLCSFCSGLKTAQCAKKQTSTKH
jgi:hypothetical protein